MAAQQVEEAAGVVARFIAHIAQGDEIAFAFTHGDLLAAAEQAYQLHEAHFETVAGQAEGHERATHARHVAVVVRAPDVDQQLVAALALVEVIGDVGGEIGLLAIGAHHHPILVIAELGGLEPLGTVLGVHPPAGAQHGER